ncbi:hypothetical protein EVAR_25948_1 [Eumeta japonica]|uniref:Uncharacterized protein n=1 Tax=Eumeta variegata TaxID=151549 RepID=A0A4C1V250_EUMVA|nr:hypothetical protein EVAR_25948_1 [Eumeta japonica]
MRRGQKPAYTFSRGGAFRYPPIIEVSTPEPPSWAGMCSARPTSGVKIKTAPSKTDSLPYSRRHKADGQFDVNQKSICRFTRDQDRTKHLAIFRKRP